MYLPSVTKTPHTSFRLSPEDRKLLAALAEADGLNMTAKLKLMIRDSARKAKVKK